MMDLIETKEKLIRFDMYSDRRPKIIQIGNYKLVDYIILYNGSHPCAYVQNLPFINAVKSELHCHGGVTFEGSLCFWLNKRDKMQGISKYEEMFKNNYIGWDYAHLGDWFNGCRDIKESFEFNIKSNNRKYTREEIWQDVCRVIDYAIARTLNEV